MEEPVADQKPILLVDNYDSYTFNLLQCITVVTGTVPVVVKNHDERMLDRAFMETFAGVVLGPGPGHPANESDVGVTKQMVSTYPGPVLGVCLGFQALGLWNGSKVVKAVSAIHGEISPVEVRTPSDVLLHRMPKIFKVVRYHSLIVCPDTLSDAVELTAVTVEGDRVVPMALKIRGKRHWGVQYHPESVCTEYGHQLLANFAQICGVMKEGWRAGEQLENNTAPMRWQIPRSEKAYKWELKWSTVQRDFFKDRLLTSEIFTALYKTSQNTVWLDSSDPRGRYSIMTDDTGVSNFIKKHRLDPSAPTDTNILSEIEGFLNDRKDEGILPSSVHPTLPFQGGFLGYIGYEMRGECMHHAHDITDVELSQEGERKTKMPDLFMVYTQRFVVVDHQTGETNIGVLVDRSSPSNADTTWGEAATKTIEALQGQTEEPLQDSSHKKQLLFVPSSDRNQYIAAIEKCKQLILEGETYEVCLTNEFTATGGIQGNDTLEFYKKLRVINAAPYAGFIRVEGCGDICSSSPERFLKIDANGMAEAKPIKGTIKRDLLDPTRDEELKKELKESKKDQCENLMIVDLLRNDLGMLCKPGTVTVPKLMDIESYKTVHQMVTTVQAQLPSDISHASAVKVTFPGGSIVGAPKVRTMSIIKDLEARSRGVYTGSLGYFSLTGCSDFNIAIRTAVVTQFEGCDTPILRLGAGGAITIQSSPEGEWDEVCFLEGWGEKKKKKKIQIMIKAYPLMRAVSQIVTGGENNYKVAGLD